MERSLKPIVVSWTCQGHVIVLSERIIKTMQNMTAVSSILQKTNPNFKICDGKADIKMDRQTNECFFKCDSLPLLQNTGEQSWTMKVYSTINMNIIFSITNLNKMYLWNTDASGSNKLWQKFLSHTFWLPLPLLLGTGYAGDVWATFRWI